LRQSEPAKTCPKLLQTAPAACSKAEEIGFIGHRLYSLGGRIIADYSSDYPEVLLRLLLIETTGD